MGKSTNALSYMHHRCASRTGRKRFFRKACDLDSALLLPLVGKALLLAQVLFLLVHVASVGSGVFLFASESALFILPARAQYLATRVKGSGGEGRRKRRNSRR